MSQTPNGPNQPASDGPDPSMEEILASIRRILNEEEPPVAAEHAAPETPGQEAAEEDDVLVLDQSMMVTEPEPTRPDAVLDPPPPTGVSPTLMETAHQTDPTVPPADPETAPSPVTAAAESFPPSYGPSLVAPETAAATASSVDGLLRTLTASRSTQVHLGGPTIEDLVREEVRPLLKDWLDKHLPPLVERLVRIEIERVVGRIVP